ncbi:hypothetical protein [Aeromonas sp. S41-2]|uniref:hypothetical protein n=1 Tax=Aeromonas sp. S41-2 TaxID=2990502 RepID=UPI0022DFF51D|nr:hypothetical protein [Aeromonas sp. S41-2]
MRCPHCMSEGVARIEDERVKRACALGLGAAGGYACAATLARMGVATGSALGGVGTVVGALAGALGGAVLGGLIGGGLGWWLGRTLDRRLSRHYRCGVCGHRFSR